MLPGVRRHERQRFLFFGGLSLLLSAAQTLGLVGSEALFLARFGAARLPEAFIAASLLTVVGSFGYALLVGRARNDTLFLWMLLASAGALAAAAVGVAAGSAWLLPVLFCAWFLLQAVFLNHFLTLAVDYFDAAASKRLFPLLTIAASLGGAVGGAAGLLIARGPGPTHLIAAWGAGFALCALLLRLGRRRLRRWGPLELEEADETSLEGMRGAALYLRRSPLGRAVALSALGMVVALFVAQYLYSELFVRAFPEPRELAAFLGVYLAVTNVVEIGVGFVATPWLIRRFGVPTANLVHPALTLLSFAALAFQPGLAAAVAARVNRELVDNATGFPVRSLVYNAMPIRLRGRMRAFLEGIVVYAGMSGAGLLLLALGRPDPLWLCAAGAIAALLFLGANLRVRRAYLESLVRQLRAGSLELADVAGELGGWEAARLADLWREMLEREGGRPPRSLLEMVPLLAARGLREPLLEQTTHPSPEVRGACLEALAGLEGRDIDAALERGLDDADPGVRRVALGGAALRAWPGLGARLRDLAADPDPSVRAESALHLGEQGAALLRDMVGAPAPEPRAAALEALERSAAEPPLSGDQVLEATRDPDPRVRRAALALLPRLAAREPRAPEVLAVALADPDRGAARTAARSLASLGDAGALAALPQLRSESEPVVERALAVLAGCGERGRLSAQLRECVQTLWVQVLSYQLLPDDAGLPGRFLRAAYRDAMLRSRRLAFRVLELLEDPSVIRKVESALRHPSARRRGDALEVLSNLGDRVASRLLTLLHEGGELGERAADVRQLVAAPRRPEDVIDASLCSEMRFVRMGARRLAGAAPDLETEQSEEHQMERLLALQRVPLFSLLSLEQLDALLRIAREAEYAAGEVICRQGDPGGVLYLLIEGRVRIYKGYDTPTQQLLHVEPEGSYFGEMAIFDHEARSATAVAETPARLLCLQGESLKQLILEMPQISLEMLRVLSGRVREAEARVA